MWKNIIEKITNWKNAHLKTALGFPMLIVEYMGCDSLIPKYFEMEALRHMIKDL